MIKVFGYFAVLFGVGEKVLFAMNFECKSTFKSKWKRFWIISLKI